MSKSGNAKITWSRFDIQYKDKTLHGMKVTRRMNQTSEWRRMNELDECCYAGFCLTVYIIKERAGFCETLARAEVVEVSVKRRSLGLHGRHDDVNLPLRYPLQTCTAQAQTGHRSFPSRAGWEVMRNYLMGVYRVSSRVSTQTISPTPPTITIFEKQRLISWLWHHVCRALCWTFTKTSTGLVDVWLSRQEVEIVMPWLAILSGVRMRGIKDPCRRCGAMDAYKGTNQIAHGRR